MVSYSLSAVLPSSRDGVMGGVWVVVEDVGGVGGVGVVGGVEDSPEGVRDPPLGGVGDASLAA